MFIIYEYASCVLVAMIVAALAVAACAVYALLKTGRGMILHGIHQFMRGASWLPDRGLATRERKS